MKEEAWQKALGEVDKIEDRLGRTVDEGIRESVAALNVMGLRTIGSCEGHLKREEGLRAPWVDIGDIPPELRKRFMDAEQKGGEMDPELARDCREAQQRILGEEARAIDLLEEFYRGRNVPLWRRLILKCYPEEGRLISQGAEIQDLYPPEVQQQRLGEFREEMNEFAAFLKNKFFY